MLDHRLSTFLTLYEHMNYRVTAELLHITQPAVTQHIHYLEREYACKLFLYNGRELKTTDKADILAQYARSAVYNEESLLKSLQGNTNRLVRIGATKTIGDYILPEKLTGLLMRDHIQLSLVVNNTDSLLQMLDKSQLDFAVVEGTFDKEQYECRLLQEEPFVGICAKSHPFANREIAWEEVLKSTAFIREEGSGTRAVLEQVLQSRSYSLQSFHKVHCITNFEAMKTLISTGSGISFAYQSIAAKDLRLATFTIQGQSVVRELNYVYLRYTKAGELVDILEQDSKM